MQWRTESLTQLTHGPLHHAFTSLVSWRGDYYVAYREAPSHGITPPGVVQIQRFAWHDAPLYKDRVTLHMGDVQADIRDPRLIVSEDALYCLVGVYQPTWPATTLSPNAPWNTIQSYISYTEDGDSWSPLQPVGRPGYWIWSALQNHTTNCWLAAAYHTGSRDESSSIYLLAGKTFLDLRMAGLMYDGGGASKTGQIWDYPHTSPSEPVLFRETASRVGCCVRTETGMEIGVAQYPYQDWRWWDTKALIHPSAVLDTVHGRLLTGRLLREKIRRGKLHGYATSTAIFRLDAQHVSDACVGFPSADDTGYAGLCATPDPTRFLVSYYSQHTTGESFRTRLPGSQVFLAAVTVTPEEARHAGSPR